MNFINSALPWVLEGIYISMTIVNLGVNGGASMYWFGAAILNCGVILMSAKGV